MSTTVSRYLNEIRITLIARRLGRYGQIALLLPILGTGCLMPTAPDQKAPYVLQMVLDPTADTQTAILSYLKTGLPAAEAGVNLSLIGAEGSNRLLSTAEAGKWIALQQVTFGGRYELTGTIDGVTISGVTNVPEKRTLAQVFDPVDARDLATSSAIPVTYHSPSVGAWEYWIDESIVIHPVGWLHRSPDSDGSFTLAGIPHSQSLPDTVVFLRFTALDRNLTIWLGTDREFAGNMPSNSYLTGVYGFLGSQVSETFPLVIRR